MSLVSIFWKRVLTIIFPPKLLSHNWVVLCDSVYFIIKNPTRELEWIVVLFDELIVAGIYMFWSDKILFDLRQIYIYIFIYIYVYIILYEYMYKCLYISILC